MKTVARVGVALGTVAAAFAIDQVTKTWAIAQLGEGQEVALGLGASLRLVYNSGVAFGIGGGVGAPLVVAIMALTAGLLVWILMRAARGRSMVATALLSLAAGGAIGNLWDRTTRADGAPLTGEVVDFIAVEWFAVFNVADIFTTLGLIGWAALLVLQREPRTSRNPTKAPSPTTKTATSRST